MRAGAFLRFTGLLRLDGQWHGQFVTALHLAHQDATRIDTTFSGSSATIVIK
jgi:hypothetical protein